MRQDARELLGKLHLTGFHYREFDNGGDQDDIHPWPLFVALEEEAARAAGSTLNWPPAPPAPHGALTAAPAANGLFSSHSGGLSANLGNAGEEGVRTLLNRLARDGQ